MLTCSICGHRGLVKMFQTTPCNHSGCADCLMRGDNCSMCGHKCALVPHPLIKLFRAPALAEDTPCASCPEDACAHCATCDRLFCEEHAAPHAEHETTEVCLYEPIPFVPVCEEHGKPFEYFVPPDRLLCEDCPFEARFELAGYEESLRSFISMLVESCVHLIGRVNKRLDNARSKVYARRETLLTVIASMKTINLGGVLRYTKQLELLEASLPLTESGLKQLECELMGVECRLDSLRAVCELSGSRFLAVAASYSDLLMRAMACQFTGVVVGMELHLVVRIPLPLRAFKAERLRKARLLGCSLVMLEGERLTTLDFRTEFLAEVQGGERVIDFAVCDNRIAVLISGAFAICTPTASEHAIFIDCKKATAIALCGQYVFLAAGSKVSRYCLERQKFDRHATVKGFVSSLAVSDKQLIAFVRKGKNQQLTFDLRTAPGEVIPVSDLAQDGRGSMVYLTDGLGYFRNSCDDDPELMQCPDPTVSVDLSADYPIALFASSRAVSLFSF